MDVTRHCAELCVTCLVSNYTRRTFPILWTSQRKALGLVGYSVAHCILYCAQLSRDVFFSLHPQVLHGVREFITPAACVPVREVIAFLRSLCPVRPLWRRTSDAHLVPGIYSVGGMTVSSDSMKPHFCPSFHGHADASILRYVANVPTLRLPIRRAS